MNSQLQRLVLLRAYPSSDLLILQYLKTRSQLLAYRLSNYRLRVMHWKRRTRKRA